MTLKIETMFAYVANDDEGEGIAAHFTPGTGWMPLVGADMDRMNSLRPIAQALADKGGQDIRLVQFQTRVEIDLIKADPSQANENVMILDFNKKED